MLIQILPVISLLLIFGSFSSPIAQIVDADGYIVVSADGASPAGSHISEAKRKKIAAETAYYAALEKLSEYIAGVEITGGVRLTDLQMSGGNVVQIVRAELKGVRERSCAFTRLKDGSYIARSTVQLPIPEKERVIRHIAELAGSVKETEDSRLNLGIGTNNSFDSKKQMAGNNLPSGLIIDLRMIAPPGFLPMAPVIRSRSGSTVFPAELVKSQILHSELAVGYAVSLRAARSMLGRIGNNPLIIRAVRIGINSSRDIIVDETDFERIMRLEDSTGLFKEGRVVLVF